MRNGKAALIAHAVFEATVAVMALAIAWSLWSDLPTNIPRPDDPDAAKGPALLRFGAYAMAGFGGLALAFLWRSLRRLKRFDQSKAADR